MFQFAPRYDSTTCGSLTTCSASPSQTTRPTSSATIRSETDMMSGRSCSITSRLAPVRSRRRSNTGARASVSRCAIPAEGSSSRITVGCAPIWHARSTMRRLPVERSATNLSRNSPSPMVSMSSSARRPSRRSERATVGTCSAAVTGSQSASSSSSAMHNVWWTVSVPKSRAFWNERARPKRARADGLRPDRSWSPSRTRPSIRYEEARDQVEERGLAGAVRSDQSEDLALVQVDRDVVERHHAGKGLGDAARSQARRSACRRSLSGTGTAGTTGLARCRTLEEDRSEKVRPLEQIGGETVEADRALLEEVGAIGGVERGVHRLLDDDHGDALRMEVPHHIEQLLDQEWAQTQRQLVDHQHLRLDEERHRDGEHLLLTARQAGGGFVEPIAERGEEVEHALGRRVDGGAVAAAHPRAHPEVVAHAERREDAPPAGYVHEPEGGDLVGSEPADVDALERHAPVVRRQET